jgi:hypothetical protein
MQYLLKTRFGFRDEDITMLMDDSPDWALRPTNANMRAQMQRLVRGAAPGDSLVFHFSGEPPVSELAALEKPCDCPISNRILLIQHPDCYLNSVPFSGSASEHPCIRQWNPPTFWATARRHMPALGGFRVRGKRWQWGVA